VWEKQSTAHRRITLEEAPTSDYQGFRR
jgi:hypothetical protein